nr:MAG TPA: hypothetical protein [Caudoviricetes sp.]
MENFCSLNFYKINFLYTLSLVLIAFLYDSCYDIM